MKKLILVTLLLNQAVFCYEKICGRNETKDIKNRASYSFTQGSGSTLETCHVMLEEKEKSTVIEKLMPFANKPLTKATIEIFTEQDAPSTRKVVFDFVTFKTQEREKSGAIYKTIEDIINAISPQGYARPLSGTTKDSLSQ